MNIQRNIPHQKGTNILWKERKRKKKKQDERVQMASSNSQMGATFVITLISLSFHSNNQV